MLSKGLRALFICISGLTSFVSPLLYIYTFYTLIFLFIIDILSYSPEIMVSFAPIIFGYIYYFSTLITCFRLAPAGVSIYYT